MNANIKEMEINDYNILQNMKAAFYRLWKMKTIVFLSTIIGVLAALIYTTLAGDELSFYSSATIYSAVYGSISETNSGVSVMNNYSSILGTTRVCERAATEINDPKITTAYLQELISSGKVKISGASASGKYGYRLVLNTVLDSPDYVTIITNEMANAFVGEINDLLGQDVVQVFDESKVVFARKGSSNILPIIILGLAGFVLSAGIIFVKEFFSSKIQVVSQCTNDRNQILGILPYSK